MTPVRFFLFVVLAPSIASAEWSLERSLALALSPGAVALLAGDTADPRARARLEKALGHENSQVRAAAARVIRASGLSQLAERVVAALEVEEDAEAAVEEMYAAASLSTDEAPLIQAAERLDLAGTAALALAASRREVALQHLDQLRAMHPDFPLLEVARVASRGRMDALAARVPVAFRTNDVELWAVYLALARERSVEVARGALEYALGSDVLREETLWHLSLLNGLEPQLLDVAASALERAQDEPGLEARFLLELLSRRAGREAHESEAWIAARRQGRSSRFRGGTVLGPRSRILPLLTKNELRALSVQVKGGAGELDEAYESSSKLDEDRSRERPHGSWAALPVHDSALQTAAGFPRGMVADILHITGCAPEKIVGVGIATIQFTGDGRPHSVSIDLSQVNAPACELPVESLLLTSVLDARELTAVAVRSTLLVLIGPEYLACLSEPPLAHRRAQRIGEATIEAPEKERDASPEYPDSALRDGVQGIVIIEALIQPQGCVSGLRVLRSADDRLSFAALAAVSKWRFEPSTVNGEPASILMTVTTAFSIR